MDPSVREDYLEAVLICTLAVRKAPFPGEIARETKRKEDQVTVDLGTLAMSGDVILNDNGSIVLTPSGQVTAERVLKKHRVLQCFLGELLGMDDLAASDEACVLEHTISDNAIRRIGDYLTETGLSSDHSVLPGPGTDKGPFRGGVTGSNPKKEIHTPGQLPGLKSVQPGTLTLLDVTECAELSIIGIAGVGDLHRLIDLGVIPGETVFLRRKLRNNAVVLEVKGCDIALSPEIAGKILVERKG